MVSISSSERIVPRSDPAFASPKCQRLNAACGSVPVAPSVPGANYVPTVYVSASEPVAMVSTPPDVDAENAAGATLRFTIASDARS